MDCCDNSRGLLLADHAGTSMAIRFADDIEKEYRCNMPVSQHGGVKFGGTDYATHLVVSAIDFALLSKMCIFIIFIDLVKACDKITRELVLGSDPSVYDPWSYLEKLRLNDAAWVMNYLGTFGPFFPSGA